MVVYGIFRALSGSYKGRQPKGEFLALFTSLANAQHTLKNTYSGVGKVEYEQEENGQWIVRSPHGEAFIIEILGVYDQPDHL